jgi:hypothetical protein
VVRGARLSGEARRTTQPRRRLREVGEFIFVAAEWSTTGRVADDKHPAVTHPDPVRVSIIDLISAPATFARHRGWSLRPFLRAGRQWKPDCGEFVVRGVVVDAIPLGIRPHGDPGPGANPLPHGVQAGWPVHSMAARLQVHDPGIVVAAKRQRRSRRGEVATTLLELRQGGEPIVSASGCRTPIHGPLPRDIWWGTFQPALAVRQLGMRLQAGDGLSVPEEVDGKGHQPVAERQCACTGVEDNAGDQLVAESVARE